MNEPTEYARAGVNLSLGDEFSSDCGKFCRGSYENSRFVRITSLSGGTHFRGLRAFEFVGLPPGTLQYAGSDGIGTKTIVADAAGMHFTSANDLLAMIGGDLTRYGGMPLVVLNHLDVKTLGENNASPTFRAAQRLMEGLAEGAKDQNYVLLGGETAELRDCVMSENPGATLAYNWGATMIGVVHPDKLITGENIQEGDYIIALEDVVRSNGISLIRRGLRKRYGDEWYKLDDDMIKRRLVTQAAAPSALYDKFFTYLNGWTTEDFQPVVKAKLIAHLSGGGIPSKFAEDLLFPRGWSATLNHLFQIPDILHFCARDLNLTDQECYDAWGCGQGALVVIDPEDWEVFHEHAMACGISIQVAGSITKTPAGEKPCVEIISSFTGESLHIRPK